MAYPNPSPTPFQRPTRVRSTLTSLHKPLILLASVLVLATATKTQFFTTRQTTFFHADAPPSLSLAFYPSVSAETAGRDDERGVGVRVIWGGGGASRVGKSSGAVVGVSKGKARANSRMMSSIREFNWWLGEFWWKFAPDGLAGEPRRPLNVVITGSSRGLGLAMAEAYLSRGDYVFINGRRQDSLESSLKYLRNKFPNKVAGLSGDVGDPDFVRMIGLRAKQFLGHVDVWINNAAVSYPTKRKFADTNPSDLARVVNTNLLGILYGTQTAYLLMRAQPTGGHIFNVEGTGSNGLATPEFVAYGASKAPLKQILMSLVKEFRGSGVCVHNVSPGVALTALQLAGRWTDMDWLRVLNVLAEAPSTIANDLVPRMRRLVCSGRGPGESGKTIRYLTQVSIFWRCLTAGWRINRWFDIWNAGTPVFNTTGLKEEDS